MSGQSESLPKERLYIVYDVVDASHLCKLPIKRWY